MLSTDGDIPVAVDAKKLPKNKGEFKTKNLTRTQGVKKIVGFIMLNNR